MLTDNSAPGREGVKIAHCGPTLSRKSWDAYESLHILDILSKNLTWQGACGMEKVSINYQARRSRVMLYFLLKVTNKFSLRCAAVVTPATVLGDRIEHLGLFLFGGES